MKITYWSDYACPYCYIGEVRLKKALEILGITDQIEIEMKSFELDPNASKTVVSSTTERFAQKYGLSKQEAANRIQQISDLGEAEGIHFKYVSTLYTNTLDAHRLTKLAQSKQDPSLVSSIIDALFDAYFTKNLELSDKNTLIRIAVDAGMDAKEVETMLNSNLYEDQVRADEKEASMYGIHGVPLFVVNDKYSLSGAQPVEAFVQVLQKILAETNEYELEQGMTCGPDGCLIGDRYDKNSDCK